MKKKIASTVAFCSLLSVLYPLQAEAIDFDGLLRNYLGVGPNTNRDSFTQSVIKTNINTRQAQLEQEVQSGVASGQLSPEEENDLRTELNRINGLEGTYLADGQLTNVEVQSMLDELTRFSTRLQAYLTNTTVVGTGTSRHDWWFKKYGGDWGPNETPQNQQLRQAHIDSRQAEIDTAISQGVTSGRLGWHEASTLRAELNRIASRETGFLADGRLSFNEQQQLNNDLSNLQSRLNRELTDANRYAGRRRGGRGVSGSRADSRQSLLRQRIEYGQRTGRLTRAEASRLLRDEQRIAQLEATLRATGGRLSYTEERRLMREIDDLSRKVNRELWDHQVQWRDND